MRISRSLPTLAVVVTMVATAVGVTVGILALPGPDTLAAQEPAGTGALVIDDRQPRVSVGLSPEELTVGDRVTAVLTVSAPRDQLTDPPRFPYWEATWGEAEVVRVERPETLPVRNGVATFRQRLVLTAFRPGTVGLPPRQIELSLAGGDRLLTTPEDLSFTIEPILPPPEEPAEGEEPTPLDPRPETPARPLPLEAPFWWALAVGGLACLGLALLLGRRARAPEKAASSLTPADRLERELADLGRAPTLVDAHAGLSLSLRRYLGQRLGFPAAESTTTEIARRMDRRQLPSTVTETTREILTACDLVKFARRTTSPGVLESRVDTAREVSRRLERHLVPTVLESSPGSPRGETGGGSAGGGAG